MRSAGFVCKLLGILLKTDFPLIKNVLKSLTKSVLISSRLTAAVSAAVARIHKKLSDYQIRGNNINNFKGRNGWYYENS